MGEREQKRLDRELAANGDPDAIARTTRLPVHGNCECDQLQKRNRELTRQVEQLQAEAKIMRANLVDADDRLAAAEEIMRAIIDDGCGPEESMEDLWDRTVHRIVQHLVRYEALTAPPSSSDHGRADTEVIT